jgi:mannitol-1-phosphate/altronate dehydrogenase
VLLDESAALQEHMHRLSNLADDKLRAMRAADVPALENCAAGEAELIREVCTRETAWKAALARLAQQLPPGATDSPTLQEMINRFSEPLRSRALARISGLEHSARQLHKKNEIAAAVARNLQEHLRGAFATIAAPPADRPTYGPPGQPATMPSRSWVDAFG